MFSPQLLFLAFDKSLSSSLGRTLLFLSFFPPKSKQVFLEIGWMALPSMWEEAEHSNITFLWPLLKTLTFTYDLIDLTPTIR